VKSSLILALEQFISSCSTGGVKEIGITEFKANCVSILERIRKTKKPVRITRHGVPIADIVPSSPELRRKFVGSMVGTGEILGDIVSPVIDLDDIEALRD
jgi:prevent-host-death family protein